ncbi:MAG: AEC family transporter [Parvularcula sp.]
MPSLPLLLAPLFSAISIGIVAGALRLFDEKDARTFARFVFSVAMPVAVFNFMRKSQPPDWSYAGLILGYGIALAIVSSLLFVLIRRFTDATIRQTGAVIFASICGNAVFLGLPIAIAIPGWGVPFLMLMVCEGLLTFAIGTTLMTWPEDHETQSAPKLTSVAGTSLHRVTRNPIIVGHLSGTVLAFAGVRLPDIVGNSLDLVGGIASPFGLIVLGLYLALLIGEQERLPMRELLISLPIKLVLFPILAAGLTWVMTGDSRFSAVAALFTGMPPAVASMVLAATYGQYERRVAAIVSVGTTIGLLTLVGFLSLVTSGT